MNSAELNPLSDIIYNILSGSFDKNRKKYGTKVSNGK